MSAIKITTFILNKLLIIIVVIVSICHGLFNEWTLGSLAILWFCASDFNLIFAEKILSTFCMSS